MYVTKPRKQAVNGCSDAVIDDKGLNKVVTLDKTNLALDKAI